VAISGNYIDGSNADQVTAHISQLKISKEPEWQQLLAVIGQGHAGMDLTMAAAGVSRENASESVRV
jgi:hypothetical protein